MLFDSQFKLQARLSEAVSGSNPQWISTHQDVSSGSVIFNLPGIFTGSLSGTTWIDILDSPPSGSVRKVTHLNFFASGSVSNANLEIALSGAEGRTLAATTRLRNNERLSYQNLIGWSVLNSSGSLRLSGAEVDSSLVGTALAIGTSQENVIGGTTSIESINTTFDGQVYRGFAATPAGARVHLVLSPGLSGSILATAPDGTAVGGNQRGSGSVDFQMSRTLATQVASGQFSVIGGGSGNTASGDYSSVGGGENNTASGDYSRVGGGSGNVASGDYSVVVGGSNNIASGDYSAVGGGSDNTASGHYSVVAGGSSNIASGEASSVPGGFGALADHTGEMSFSPGFFEEIGDLQQSLINWNLVTTGSLTTVMDCGNQGDRFVLHPSSSYSYQIRVLASSGSDDGFSVAWWEHIGCIRRSGDVSTVELISGSFTSLSGSDTGLENWNSQVVANTVSGSLDIEVTTDTSGPVIWCASAMMVKNQRPTQSLFIEQFDETIVDNITAVTGSITVPVPAATVSGSLLIGYISGRSNSGAITITDPAGWNSIYTATGTSANGVPTSLAWRLADGTEDAEYSWNFSTGNLFPVGKIIAIPSGSFDSDNPIESHNMFSSGTSANNTTQVIDSLIATNNDSLLLTVGGAGIGSGGVFSIVGMPRFGLLGGESGTTAPHIQNSSISKVPIGPTPITELRSARGITLLSTTWTRGAVLIRGPS